MAMPLTFLPKTLCKAELMFEALRPFLFSSCETIILTIIQNRTTPSDGAACSIADCVLSLIADAHRISPQPV